MAESLSNEKFIGAVAYFLGPVTGVFLLVTEKKNPFIRFHAMQSTLLFGGIMLLRIVVPWIPWIGWMLLMMVAPLLYIGSFIIWIVLMWQAYQGNTYKIPYVGDMAEEQLKKIS